MLPSPDYSESVRPVNKGGMNPWPITFSPPNTWSQLAKAVPKRSQVAGVGEIDVDDVVRGWMGGIQGEVNTQRRMGSVRLWPGSAIQL